MFLIDPVFPLTAHTEGYSNEPGANLVTQLAAEQILPPGEKVAAQFVEQLGDLTPCEVSDAPKD